ncbi:MAG: 2-C-methyl-D-erythritol 4-phosphate cytidylyltransferase [bacterium]
MKTEAIIVAAGSGKRMKSKLPKQFISIGGKTILAWSVTKLLSVPEIKKIILVAPSAYNIKYAPYILPIAHHKVKIVEGGKQRADSVKAGLAHISSDCGLVLIHDAVRPLIKSADIKKCISAGKKSGAAIAAAPCTDTVKLSRNNGSVHKTLDRSKIWLVQTPQVFAKKYLDNVFKIKNIPDVTDDSQLIEKLGKKVMLVNVGSYNRKITQKEDLLFAESQIKSYKS